MALNPHQRKKVDISAMTEEEQKLFRLYGKLPPKKNVAKHNLMERKYFDSGDYALSKAGKTAPQSVGTTIPSPENIHHATHSAISTPTLPHPPLANANSDVNIANTGVLPTPGGNDSALKSVDTANTTEGGSKEVIESAFQSDDTNPDQQGLNHQDNGRISELHHPTDLQPQ